MVYRDFTDYARACNDWLRDFKRVTGREVESLDPDSIEGEIFCRSHDIVEYPTIVALTPDGTVHQTWRGRELPSFNEVSYYIGGEF
jgi:hypothetical protein